MAVNDKLSTLVAEQFPDFYKEEGPKFLAFMEAYYEYLETTGKMTDAIRNLQSYQDISTTTDDFLQYFITTFLPNVPLDIAADKRLFVKNIIEGNLARGTLAAYKLLFRALYNEEVELNYPSDQILKVSDGDWRKERYLVSSYDPTTYNFIAKTIVGTESGAQALVEDIIRKNIRGRDIMQILVSNVRGAFNDQEPIRLFSDTQAEGHTTIVEAGIDGVTILSPGGEYRQGDVVNLISSDKGDFGKVVVTQTQDLGGTLTFSLTDGGSGYTASTDPGGSVIEFIGGDGSSPASFQIGQNDIVDTFAIAINTNLISSNNVFGSLAPTVQFANGSSGQMSIFANTILSAADYGFPEAAEEVTNRNYRDHANAIINLANTYTISVGASLYGNTSSANATVLEIVDSTAGDAWFRVDTYRQFTNGEHVHISNTTGTDIGTVNSFQGNTIGYHVAQIGWIANTSISPLNDGDEIVGRTSGAFGVVKKVVALTANGYSRGAGGADDRDLYTVQVTANNTANLTSQFDTGPMKRFLENEGLRLVGANTTVGNVVSSTSNSSIENIYTRLSDAFNFESTTFGTIASLSLPVGGSGYTVAPQIRVRENDIAALGVGEQYITLHSNNINWGSGNSSFTKLDTNDKLSQANTGASGEVKGGSGPNQLISSTVLANGTFEMIVRVWQDPLQRRPGNIQFANNQFVDLEIYDSSHVFGEVDTRTPADYATAKIVKIQDEGILGENAVITAGVGANGTITGLRVLDSGFCYRDNEIVLLQTPSRNLGTSARVQISLGDVANSEGYYATSRSQLDTLRGYIQDGRFYQEFSYELVSPISLDRYRDYALELVHPAGQGLFGQYRTQSNADINVSATSVNRKRSMVDGTVSINNGSFDVTGSGSNFTSVYANGEVMVIEVAPKEFYQIPINIVSNDTTANLTIAWANTNLSGANAYYYTGSIS
jgi:hypothetical protein